ncbi:hypothetical protein PJE062_2975 [Pseudovibrio sp. JE062]|nr:hypothetical protein PJE062_2975 [Pseudovibrio sp. JE062]
MDQPCNTGFTAVRCTAETRVSERLLQAMRAITGLSNASIKVEVSF